MKEKKMRWIKKKIIINFINKYNNILGQNKINGCLEIVQLESSLNTKEEHRRRKKKKKQYEGKYTDTS